MIWPAVLGACLNIIGDANYAWKTIQGKTQPNRMTWFMWAVAPMIGTAAALSSGVTWATLTVFMAGFCPLIVFLTSFVNKNAYWKLERFDYVCGAFSLLALILWGITGIPAVAIVFAILSDLFAATPTLIKAWRFPDTETTSGYSLSAASNALSFLTVTNWNFASVAFPLYLVIINTTITFAVVRTRGIKRMI